MSRRGISTYDIIFTIHHNSDENLMFILSHLLRDDFYYSYGYGIAPPNKVTITFPKEPEYAIEHILDRFYGLSEDIVGYMIVCNTTNKVVRQDYSAKGVEIYHNESKERT